MIPIEELVGIPDEAAMPDPVYDQWLRRQLLEALRYSDQNPDDWHEPDALFRELHDMIDDYRK